MNVTICNLDMEQAGRHTRLVGAHPDLRSATATAYLIAAGCDVTTIAGTRARSLTELARAVGRDTPDAVVLTINPSTRDVVTALAGLLSNGPTAAASRPRLVLIGSSAPSAREDAQWLDKAEHGAWLDANAPSAMLAGLGLPADHTDRSPYLSGVLPAQQATEYGVLMTGRRDPHVLGEEIAWLDARLPQGTVVPLIGTGGADLVTARPRPAHLRWTLSADLAQAAEAEALARAGAVGITLLCRRPVGFGTDPRAALRDTVNSCEAAGLAVTLHLPTLAAWPYEAVADIADIADIAAEYGLAVTFGSGPVEPPVDPSIEQDARDALARVDCPTLRREAELSPAGPFHRLLTGRYPKAAAHNWPIDIAAADPAHVPLLANPGNETVGLVTTVIVADSDRATTDRPFARPPFGQWASVDGPAFDEPGLYRVTEGADIEVLGYAQGRDVTPLVPLVLRFTGTSDVSAFLADADRAVELGLFPPALGRLTALADTGAFDTPDRAAPLTLPRLYLDRAGRVRPGPAGPELGDVRTPLHALRLALREQGLRARERRSALDPASATTDLSLAGLLDDDAYTAMRAARPWLHRYLRIWEAVQHLPPLVPGELRVAGFGAPLLLPVTEQTHAPDAVGALPDAPLLLAHGEQHLLYAPDSRRAFRLSTDAAMVTEALLSRANAEGATELVRRALGDRAPAAPKAVADVAGMLRSQNAWPAAAA